VTGLYSRGFIGLCGTVFEFLNFIYITVVFNSFLNCVTFVVAICGQYNKYWPQITIDLLCPFFVIRNCVLDLKAIRKFFPTTFIFSAIMYWTNEFPNSSFISKQ
jgi:hypothetical protein